MKTVNLPNQCTKLARCDKRHLCDAEGGIYYKGQRVADCPKYVSRQDAYEIRVMENVEGERR